MAILPEDSHDSTDVPPETELKPVPTGEYKVIIIDSEMKDTKSTSNDFQYLNVTMQIISGEYKGQCFFTMFNLVNSEAAMKIANRQFSSLKHAIGILVCRDSVKLHDKPFMAKVKFVPAELDDDGNEKWGAKNEVKAYKAIEVDEDDDPYDPEEDEDEDEIIEEPVKSPVKKKKKKKKTAKKKQVAEEEDEDDDEFDGPDWDK